MKRLTERYVDGTPFVLDGARYVDILEKLATYEDLEEKGLLHITKETFLNKTKGGN